MTSRAKITAVLALAGGAAMVPALASAERAVEYPELEGPYLIGAQLDGAQVAPGPGSASGAATIGIDAYLSQRKVCYQLEIRSLDTVTGAYVHKGEKGEVGPVRLTLFEDPEGRAGNGYYEGCVTEVRKRLIRRMLRGKRRHGSGVGGGGLAWANGTWYADVRTREFPDGAIRGQLGAGMPCPTCFAEPAPSR